MEEIWKDVDNYEGFYKVSNLGRVRSISRVVYSAVGNGTRKVQGRVLKPRIHTEGYKIVYLSRYGIKRNMYMHRLVGKAFVDGYSDELDANHLDFDRGNNLATNLEFCSHVDNIRYSWINGRYANNGFKKAV